MERELSPKQVARALGVSEASVKRWCDRGVFRASRTPGGHRRIRVSSILAFLRAGGGRLMRPEVLGLPSTTGGGEAGAERGADVLRDVLIAGDAESARGLVFGLWLDGVPAAEIFDRWVAPAFREVGCGWERGEVAVWEERRACELAARLLHELAAALGPAPPGAPVALGGTLSGDAYALATVMAEIVLREEGWNAQSLGVDLPSGTVVRALERERPRLLWLSVSHVPDEAALVEGWSSLRRTAGRTGTTLAVGGRALEPSLVTRLEGAVYCHRMQDLVELAGRLAAEPSASDRTAR